MKLNTTIFIYINVLKTEMRVGYQRKPKNTESTSGNGKSKRGLRNFFRNKKNLETISYERIMNHRDLCQIQTIKKFFEQGYNPINYDPSEELLYLENQYGSALTMAEVSDRVAKILVNIQDGQKLKRNNKNNRRYRI